MSQLVIRSFKSLLPYVLAVLLTSFYAWYLGGKLLQAEQLPVSDFAADLLLENKIDDQGYLLTGHYSRFEFNHPGPFFFYAYHGMHRILDIWKIPSSASAYAATMVLNVFFLVVGILLAHRVARLRPGFWSTLCSVLIVFSMFDHGVHHIWMPYKIITPLFAFFFSLILIARREIQYVPIACFLVSVLIHGYLSMVVLALPVFFVALFIGLRQGGLRQGGLRIEKVEVRYLAAAAVVAAIFVLPIVIDCLINEVSNPERILEYMHEAKIRSPRLAQILTSITEHAFHGFGVIQLSLLLSGTYIFNATDDLRRIWKSALLLALALTVVFVIYHKFVPRPMYNNMVLFMQAVPMALVTLCVVGVFRFVDAVDGRRALNSRILIAGLVLLACISGMSLRPAHPDTSQDIRRLAQGVMLGALKSGGARIGYADHGQWPVIAGVLYELKQQRFNACTTSRYMAFLYTDQQICPEGAMANMILVPDAQCNGQCVFSAGGTGIKLPPP